MLPYTRSRFLQGAVHNARQIGAELVTLKDNLLGQTQGLAHGGGVQGSPRAYAQDDAGCCVR